MGKKSKRTWKAIPRFSPYSYAKSLTFSPSDHPSIFPAPPRIVDARVDLAIKLAVLRYVFRM